MVSKRRSRSALRRLRPRFYLIRLQLNFGVLRQHPTESTLFFITLEASPKPAHAEYGTIDGAFVSCWINEPTAHLAEDVARASIESAGWDALELDECRLVSRQEFVENPEALKLFDQASIDGWVLTFHTWPVGGDND